MLKVVIEIEECENWTDVYSIWNSAPERAVFKVEIDGELEEFAGYEIEARAIEESEETALEEAQEDATEKGMY